MFRSARWMREKNKIKAVFRLQFHVTLVPQLNVDGLILSLVPGDAGKPTVRLEKALVCDGSCRWENPIYETVRFLQNSRTGKINQRVYHFIVSTTGSTKAGLVGEVSVDFADYADAIKPSNISLPLKNSDSKAVLHISIQRQQGKADQQSFCRQVEEHENAKLRSQDHGLKPHLSNGDADESIKNDSQEDMPPKKPAQNAELRHRASTGSDSTTSSSESISELTLLEAENNADNNMKQNLPSFVKPLCHPSMLLQPQSNAYEDPQISESEWSGSSDRGASTDDRINSSHGTFPREMPRSFSDVAVEKLKAELVALTRQVDVSDLELQTLRKQLVKEGKRGQDILRGMTSLKQERDSLKAECERLKGSEKSKIENKLQLEGGDPWTLLEEIRQEMNYEKDLNSNLRLQLQKTQESNNELILAVQDLEAMLEQKTKDASNGFRENPEELGRSSSSCETDEDQKALEELVKEHRDNKTCLLEQNISELYNEIEIHKRDKDELEIQMEQLALDYEILKQENHDISYRLEQSQIQEQLKMQYECSSSWVNVNELENQVESLEIQLQKQSEEFSESLIRIKELESQIDGLEEEMEKQAQVFEADIEVVTRSRIEQEQRAIRTEEALRKTRWRNASVAGKLHEEFKRLSEQMTSSFDANEKMAAKAITEANGLRMRQCQLEEMLKIANDELRAVKEDYEAKLHEFSELLSLKTNQIEKMSEDLEAKSKRLETQQKHQEEVTGNLFHEISRLKDENESLRKDRNFLSQQAEHAENLRRELGEMEKLVKETEASVQREKEEKTELESTIESMKKESERLMGKLCEMNIKYEKETAVKLLQSELETFKAQCNDLKHSSVEDEAEKKKLRKQVVQLKGDLKKKEDALNIVEKKLMDANARATVSNGTKTGFRNNRAALVFHGYKEVSGLKVKIKLLEEQIKLKESALEASTNSFLEKEKDLRNKIEELESRLDGLDQNSTNTCEYQSQEEVKDNFVSNGVDAEGSGKTVPSNKSENVDLQMELASLKERNQAMESELTEMQERYSEISLRFAEVEGERQRLVMTVRTLKSYKKR